MDSVSSVVSFHRNGVHILTDNDCRCSGQVGSVTPVQRYVCAKGMCVLFFSLATLSLSHGYYYDKMPFVICSWYFSSKLKRQNMLELNWKNEIEHVLSKKTEFSSIPFALYEFRCERKGWNSSGGSVFGSLSCMMQRRRFDSPLRLR